MKIRLSVLVAAFAALSVAFAVAMVTPTSVACCAEKTSAKNCEGCDKEHGTQCFAATDEGAKLETAEIKLPTMVCGMCVKTITKAVKSVEGVSGVTVDKKEKVAKVTFDPQKTNLGKIQTAITKAGYAAGDMKADAVAFEKLDECCKMK